MFKEKKNALNKPFLLHLGKARPKGKNEYPRQADRREAELGTGWTASRPRGKLWSLRSGCIFSVACGTGSWGRRARQPEEWSLGDAGH